VGGALKRRRAAGVREGSAARKSVACYRMYEYAGVCCNAFSPFGRRFESTNYLDLVCEAKPALLKELTGKIGK